MDARPVSLRDHSDAILAASKIVLQYFIRSLNLQESHTNPDFADTTDSNPELRR